MQLGAEHRSLRALSVSFESFAARLELGSRRACRRRHRAARHDARERGGRLLQLIEGGAVGRIGHAAADGGEEVGHRVLDASLALQQHERRERRRVGVVGRLPQVQRSVRSVRSRLARRMNASFCRSDPVAT